jgi:hypothetical protein
LGICNFVGNASATVLFLTTASIDIATKALDASILRTLHYFAFFNHALDLEELHCFLGIRTTKNQLEQRLRSLTQRSKIKSKYGLWAFEEGHLELRHKSKTLNDRMMRSAQWMGRFIQLFPFVRGVYVSGSLSKRGATTKEDDLDFFIITKKGRVWTTKLMLIAFKKVFLLNREKYFCINLLMAEDQLELKKKNLYIATEAASLLPITNTALLASFLNANSFIKEYFPNFEIPKSHERSQRTSFFESIIDGLFGNALEKRARTMFDSHVQANRMANGYYDTSENVSAYFPESIEDQLLTHLSNPTTDHE